MYTAMLSVLVVLFATGVEPAAEPQVPSSSELERAVGQLSAAQFAARQEATEWLWHAGEVARPYLERALRSRDSETRLRARKVLDRFELGIFADTPAEVAWQIERFRVGQLRERTEALRHLAELGAVPTVLRLLRLDNDERLVSAARPGLVAYLREKGTPEQILGWWEETPGELLKQDLLNLTLNKYQARGDLEAIEQLGRSHPHPALQLATRKWIETSLTSLIRPLAEQDSWDRVRSLIELGAISDRGMRHRAVFELLQGNLEKLIAQYKTAVEGETTSNAAAVRQLVYFLRAQGDFAGAQQMAARLGKDGSELRAVTLVQAQLWDPALEQLLAPPDEAQQQPENRAADENQQTPRLSVEQLGSIAAFQKESGQELAFQNTVVKIYHRGLADMISRSTAAETLLILGETTRGLDLKTKSEDQDVFRLLCRQFRYADAFRGENIGIDRATRDRWFAQTAEDLRTHARGSHDRLQTALQVVLVLSQVGHREEAEHALKLLGEVVQNDGFTTRVRALCETAMQAGRDDLAFQHAASSIAKDLTMLKVLFPQDERTATTLWEHFRETRGDESSRASLQRVRELMSPTPGSSSLPADLEEVIRALQEKVQAATGVDREHALLATGQLNLIWKRDDEAVTCYHLIADQSALAALRLADLYAARRAWEPAAKWYGRVWELDRTRVGAVYLQGHMLAQLGATAEATRLMRLAKLLPLGDSELRFDGLGKMLSARKLQTEAIEQWGLTFRNGFPNEKPVLDTASELGRVWQRTDPLLATHYWRQILLACLGRFRFTQPEGYIHMPYLIERTTLENQITAKDFSAVVTRARRTMAICPGDGSLVEPLVTALNEAGQPQLADELFNQTWEIMDANCRLFAQSAQCRNDLAWLAARCDRQLDAALRYAKQATELAPQRASYLDTLAEVHFRRDEIAEAIACSERCLALEPNNRFFQEQATRFRAAQVMP